MPILSKKTNGRVKVEVFSNGSLYSDGEEMDALLRGDVQMIAPTFSKVTELIPEWQVLDLPYLFQDYHDVERTFTGSVGKQLLAMLDSKGIEGLALWSNGFKQMTSTTRLLVRPDDFRGLRFRIMPSEVIEEQFRLLGGEPIVVSFDHVYRSLEKHEFDGQENTISNIYSKGFYKFQPYITISNHGYLGYAVMMNKSFWESLPRDIQQKITEAIQETTMWNLQQSKNQNEQELEEIKQNENIHIYELSEEEKSDGNRNLRLCMTSLQKSLATNCCAKSNKDKTESGLKIRPFFLCKTKKNKKTIINIIFLFSEHCGNMVIESVIRTTKGEGRNAEQV